MHEYQSITNVVEAYVPPITLAYPSPCSGSYTYPGMRVGPPASTTKILPPSTSEEHRSHFVSPRWKGSRESGAIVMTPHSWAFNSEVYQIWSRKREFRARYRKQTTCGSVCGPIFDSGVLPASWTENYHYGDGNLSLAKQGHVGAEGAEDFESSLSDAISVTQQEAEAQASSTYDLLTELAEAGETLRFLSDVVKSASHTLGSFAHQDEHVHRRARKLSPRRLLNNADKAMRTYGGRWMKYRYALMPLFYSVKDISELLRDRNRVYKTGRSSRSVTALLRPAPTSYTFYTYDEEERFAEIRSTYKVRYDSGALLRVLDQVQLNPFVTAWELVPFSFVADWFFNIGTAIEAATLSRGGRSEAQGCTSVKRTTTQRHGVRDISSDTSVIPDLSKCGVSIPYEEFIYTRDDDQILMEEVGISYSRTLYTASQPAVHYDPYLTWQRILDGIVLGLKPTMTLLKRL